MSPRAGLDQSQVVRAAAELVNAEGPEALTLGRLAKYLGVKPPSLYNHIEGLPGLQRELALLNARLLAEHLGNAAIGKAGAQAIRAVAHAFRAYIKGHPGVYLMSLRSSSRHPQVDDELENAEATVVKIVLAALKAFRLQDEEALHTVRALRSLVHGFATLEIAGGFGIQLDIDDSFQRMVEMIIRGASRPAQLSKK